MVQFLLYMIYTNVKMPQKKPFMVRYMPVNFAYFQDTLELIQAKGNLKKKKKKVASCKCPSGKVSSQGKTGQSTKGSSSKSTRSTKSCGEQYQLNMADIPFLRGKVWLWELLLDEQFVRTYILLTSESVLEVRNKWFTHSSRYHIKLIVFCYIKHRLFWLVYCIWQLFWLLCCDASYCVCPE